MGGLEVLGGLVIQGLLSGAAAAPGAAVSAAGAVGSGAAALAPAVNIAPALGAGGAGGAASATSAGVAGTAAAGSGGTGLGTALALSAGIGVASATAQGAIGYVEKKKQARVIEAQARAAGADTAEQAAVEYRRALSLAGTQRAISGASGIASSPLIITGETLGLAAKESMAAVGRARENIRLAGAQAKDLRQSGTLGLAISPALGLLNAGGMIAGSMVGASVTRNLNLGRGTA